MSNFKNLYHRNKRVDWHGTKNMWADRMLYPSCDFQLWPHPWPRPWIFKVKFLIALFYEWEGGLPWNERDVSWMQCWMDNELDTMLGGQWACMANTWPSNGSMWNCYRFQPVDPWIMWMGCPLTDLGLSGVVVLWMPCFFCITNTLKFHPSASL